ncbi:MAG: hypothetical protein WD757_06715 [Actinomycetota bacterium]
MGDEDLFKRTCKSCGNTWMVPGAAKNPKSSPDFAGMPPMVIQQFEKQFGTCPSCSSQNNFTEAKV